MPTDAVILEHVENIVIPTSTKTLVQLAPMQPGRSYVIWGMGSVSMSNAKITFELEAFDARDTVELIYSDREHYTRRSRLLLGRPSPRTMSFSQLQGSPPPLRPSPEGWKQAWLSC